MTSIDPDAPPLDAPLPDERSDEHAPIPTVPEPDHHPGDPAAPPPEPPADG